MNATSTWEASRLAEERAEIGSAELRWKILEILSRDELHDGELHALVLTTRKCSHQSNDVRRNELVKLGYVDAVGRRDGRTVHRTNDCGREVLAESSAAELNTAWKAWKKEHAGKVQRAIHVLRALVDAIDSPGDLYDDRLTPALDQARDLLK